MRNLLLAAFAVLFLASPAISQSAVDPAATSVPSVIAPAVPPVAAPAAVPAATPVAVVPLDTVVSVPIGAWINTAISALGVGLGGLVIFGLRLLPARFYALAMTMQADQLLTKALSYALNIAGTAVANKVWTVDTRNQVLKDFATYVILHGADAVKEFIGSPADIVEKGIARLNGVVDGPKPDVAAIGAQANAAASTAAAQRT